MDWADGLVRQMPDSWVEAIVARPGDLFSQVSDGCAAWGDTLSFGITSHIRQGLGYDTVDYDSTGYFVGRWVGVGHGFLLGYKAGGAAPEGYRAYLAWRAAQGYTAAGVVYGVGHSSYVLATDPQNFGFVDALGFVPLGGYVTSMGLSAPRMWWQSWRLVPATNRPPLWTGTANLSPIENAYRHFRDHGADFGAVNALDYVARAHRFLHHPPPFTQTAIRPNGDVLRYNIVTGTFGVMAPNGATRTFFKPVEGIEYWKRQINQPGVRFYP